MVGSVPSQWAEPRGIRAPLRPESESATLLALSSALASSVGKRSTTVAGNSGQRLARQPSWGAEISLPGGCTVRLQTELARELVTPLLAPVR